MKKIIYFELRKYFFRRYYFIIVLLMLFINSMNIFLNYKTQKLGYEDIVNENFVSEKKWEAYESLHRKLDGSLNREKVEYIIQEYKQLQSSVEDRTYSTEFDENTFTGYIYGDYTFLAKQFYEPIQYLVRYEDWMNEKLKRASDNIEYYTEYQNTYECEKNEYILKNYSNRRLNYFSETKIWAKLFEYNFSDFLIIVLMLLGIVPIFCSEKNIGMYHLISTTKKGDWNLRLGKCITSVLPTIVLVTVFSILNFVMYDVTFGLSGGNNAIYAIKEYKESPLNCTIFEFYIMINVLKCLGFTVLGLFFCMISEKLSSIVEVYIVSVAITFVSIYCSGYVKAVEGIHIFLSLLSPLTLLKGVDLYQKFGGVEVFHHFFTRGTISIGMNIGVVLVILGNRLLERRKKGEV